MDRPTLRRGIGRAGFFALAFGSMIGVGWVTALGPWLTSAGPGGTIVAFVAGGLLMAAIGLCYAELCAAIPVAGGEVAYAYAAYGSGKAFLVGWFLAFGYLAVSAFEAISVGRVASQLWPQLDVVPLYQVGEATIFLPHLLLALICTGGITWINYRGVQQAARLQVVLTAAFILVALVFVVAGLVGGDLGSVEPWFAGDTAGTAALGVASVLVTAPFWFVGFDTIPQGAEEASGQVPPRFLGVVLLGSIAGAAVFYCLLVTAVAATGPWQQTAVAELPAAAAFEQALGSPLLGKCVLVAALLGLFTSWNGFFLAGSRVLFALGRGRIGPPLLGRTHARFGTPANAVLLSGAITLGGALLGRGAMVAFIDVGSFCIAIAFFGVAFSATRLRTLRADLPRPYRMPGGRIVPAVSMLGAGGILLAMLVPGSPVALVWPLEWLLLLAVIVLGWLFWHLGRPARAGCPEPERERLVLGDYARDSSG
ncbi:MAG: APC family permease [Planctomycetes bacterium]|nr:APC family permease [Planctomycetota bacterium]